MGDRNLNELLKWSLANTAPAGATGNNSSEPKSSNEDTKSTSVAIKSGESTAIIAAGASAPGAAVPSRGLSTEALAALFGGPSDAELMQDSMVAITSPDISIENKLVAFDNLEQLIESLDNANLLSKLGLWTPLLEQLGHSNPGIRKMAAWCVGTAVQNNAASQERLLALGGVEKLVAMVTVDGKEEGKVEKDVRKKAVYAISSAVRNYQPAMDVVTEELVRLGKRKEEEGKVDAKDMDAVDGVVGKLREQVNGV